MEYIVDFICYAPMVQILDAPVPQTVEQLPDILRFFDTLMPDPEQVVGVPKILPVDVPVRTAVREPQMAEQLVEVPTLVSPSLPVDVKEEDTNVAVVSDAVGRTWFQVSGPRGRSWLAVGFAPHPMGPPRVHRQARAE